MANYMFKMFRHVKMHVWYVESHVTDMVLTCNMYRHVPLHGVFWWPLSVGPSRISQGRNSFQLHSNAKGQRKRFSTSFTGLPYIEWDTNGDESCIRNNGNGELIAQGIIDLSKVFEGPDNVPTTPRRRPYNESNDRQHSNINSKFYFCMSIDIPLISILMSIYMENLLKITHNLNASK